MTKKGKRLPPASSWRERSIYDWNTTTFHAYMQDLHKELFGVDYVPFRNWQVEVGMLGNAIGTKTKEGKYDKKVIKEFIDLTFHNYRPTPQYPGVSFGFLWSYRKQDLQRAQYNVMHGLDGQAGRKSSTPPTEPPTNDRRNEYKEFKGFDNTETQKPKEAKPSDIDKGGLLEWL